MSLYFFNGFLSQFSDLLPKWSQKLIISQAPVSVSVLSRYTAMTFSVSRSIVGCRVNIHRSGSIHKVPSHKKRRRICFIFLLGQVWDFWFTLPIPTYRKGSCQKKNVRKRSLTIPRLETRRGFSGTIFTYI